jgi:dethiobiotin synthetase
VHAVFVTGTDTGVGKTLVAAALLHAAARRGLRTLGLKPVAAGCVRTPAGLRNDDALALQAASTCVLPYDAVNPVALEAAIAPHIAAAGAGIELTATALAAHCRAVLAGAAADAAAGVAGADAAASCAAAAACAAVVEGAGGWLVPLNERETLADVARALGLPVLLVVGMRLGCLNHALLTAGAIAASGLPLAGWVANCVEPDMPAFDANLQTLRARLPAPCLGVVAHLPGADPARAAGALDSERLWPAVTATSRGG